MSQLRTCPACQYENSIFQVECLQCGVRLDDETLPSALFIAARLEQPLRHSHLPGHNWPPYALALFVTGNDTPILLPYEERMVLGRSKSSEAERRLDLTSYGAAMFGVSRRHASITFSGDDCLLEDLGSSNGTWLNGNRLAAYKPHPLQNGDVIRLGQLLLFVSFRLEPEAA